MGWPAALAATAGVLRATGDVVSGFYDAQGIDAQVKESKYNAQQSRYAAAQAYQEGSLAVSQKTAEGRQNIASGEAAMSAAGNIGTSAQSALMHGYFNLSKDVSAIDYKYSNEAIQHKSRAAMYEYNADIYEINRKNRVISSWLGATTSLTAGGAQAAYYRGLGGGK